MGVSERPSGPAGPGDRRGGQDGDDHDRTPVDELIAIALADTDPDGPARWQAISTLQGRGDLETFTVARRLCGSSRPAERVLGADILGELGRDRPFSDRSLPVLRYLAADELDARVLYSVLIAFGHLRDRRALPSVIDLAAHENPTVRYGAAYALPHVMGDPPDPAGLAALRRLATDPDEDVADWAALGLSLSGHTPERGGSAAGGEVEDLGGQVLDP
ncbi:HEAT repeat domain-containing protein [Microbispora sp. NPDC049125]|uniref:HEAT repeat domain-containing protein n=1 Tax=Microbispora sp. NPDC049125 TaxID=3154929 RepID=UPI003467BCC6